MGVHTCSVITIEGFGHEGYRAAILVSHVLKHVLEPHELVAHLEKGLKAHINLGLACGGDLMVLTLGVDSKGFQGQKHLGTHILKLIRGRDRKVTFFVAWFVSKVGALVPASIPDALYGIHLIEASIACVVIAYVIKDEELGLWAKEGSVSNTCALKICLCLFGNVSGVS